MRGEYVPRAQSIRPEPVHREYAGSVRPEGRGVQSQIIREYSVRPGEEGGRREYLPPRPQMMEEYQPAPAPRPVQRRVVEEEGYGTWRRGEDVYTDDTLRDVVYK
jgi:hypothetical protein